MLYKKFRAFAQVIGCVTIGLLAVYGLLAIARGGSLALAAAALAPAAAPSQQSGPTPLTLGYLGNLKDPSGEPLDGYYTMTFRLYSNPIDPITDTLWAETHISVSVRGGLFSVVLGGEDPIANPLNAEYFSGPQPAIALGIQVEPYDELQPRQGLTSVPYSMHTNLAVGLSAPDGDPVDAVVVGDDGHVGIGTDPDTTTALVIEGRENDGTKASLRIESGGQTMFLDSNEIDGSNFLSLNYNSGKDVNLVGNSASSGKVGIGTIAPWCKLDVHGDARVTGDAWVMGNVGIGTSSPSVKLDVNGDIQVTDAHVEEDATIGGVVGIGGDTTIGGDADVSGILDAAGLTINGREPFKLAEISINNDSPVYTGIGMDYLCVTTDFQAHGGDVNEDQNPDDDIIQVYTARDPTNTEWTVTADFTSDSQEHETWTVWILCIDVNMVEGWPK